MKNKEYLLALHRVNGLGPVRLKVLLDYYKDPKSIWEAKERELSFLRLPENVIKLLIETRRKLDPYSYVEGIKKEGIKYLTIFDEDYHDLLKEIYDPPVVLFYQGEFSFRDRKSVAVVGTRKMSGYGKLVTEKLTRELVEYGVTIVSGLARGVDTQVHRSAINHGGRTIAVLGGGLLRLFPPENINLAKEIAAGHGIVLSEFPPDSPSLPGNFPARNRIISGLSKGVIVTEAAEDSGSLITAKLALDQGREVFAVPGPITSDLSKGPAFLIKEGAKLVTEAKEVIEELGWEVNKVGSAELKVLSNAKFTETEERIIKLLEGEQAHVDEICRVLNLPVAIVSACLIKMEIAGFVKNLGGGFYIKVC